MSEPENNERGESEQGGASSDRYFTLSEVSQKTGISMPTLQRYKKLYQNRIPSQGKGRKQRYPESALPVFDELRNENAGRRGRPRKDASSSNGTKSTAARGRGRTAAKATKPAAKPAKAAASSRGAAAGRKAGSKRGAAAAAAPAPRGRAAAGRKPAGRTASAGRATAARGAATRGAATRGAAAGRGAARGGRRGGSGNLLTLTQISETTGISYPTLVRYVRMHADRLPSEGTGRARRFYPQAVEVFRQLRQESGRGGRKKGSGSTRGAAAASTGTGRGGNDAAVNQRLRTLEKQQQDLEKRMRGFVQSLNKLFR